MKNSSQQVRILRSKLFCRDESIKKKCFCAETGEIGITGITGQASEAGKTRQDRRNRKSAGHPALCSFSYSSKSTAEQQSNDHDQQPGVAEPTERYRHYRFIKISDNVSILLADSSPIAAAFFSKCGGTNHSGLMPASMDPR